MRILSAFVLLLLVTPAARAEEKESPEDRVTPAVVRTAGDGAPAAPALRLQEARPEQRAAADALAAQEMPQRGSFWWLVGVIVVAGIILAVLL